MAIELETEPGLRAGSLATRPAAETPKRRSLIDITEDMQALDDLLDECGGDITGIEETVDRWFAELKGELNSKLDGYAAFIRELDLRIAARTEEKERLEMRIRVDSNLQQFLKLRLRDCLASRNQRKVETRRYRISLVKNGGKAPLVWSNGRPPAPESVSAEFQRVRVEIDTDAVRQSLESGKELEFARIGERGEHVRIA